MDANADEKLASRWLVSTDWLAPRLGAPERVVVDGSFYLPRQARRRRPNILAGHIPGAVRFDIDAIADHSNPLPHMLPPAEQFARDVGALGIGDGDTIVVYDGAGVFGAAGVVDVPRCSAPRRCSSSTAACRNGRPKAARSRPARSSARRASSRRSTAHSSRRSPTCRALLDKTAQVVDARPADRFRGDAPEPRPGVRSGHMPGALNVPFDE